MPELPENILRLRSIPGVGNTTVWRLLRHFGSADAVLNANTHDLAAALTTSGSALSHEKIERIQHAAHFDPRPELDKAAQAGIDLIPYDDPSYPKPLLHTFDPPLLLYVRGQLTDADMVAVGIVGTRQATPYGRDSALELSGLLARGGYTIVSGLARGIDTFAHIGALKAGGRTVGVLGCGFDHMYPEENRDLALEMSRNGAVVSEFPMATAPSRETFPMRNRIIAGMAMGLLVIEAPLRSGSLITARLASEVGRSVFAIPGRVGDPGSEGCNKLIRDGATIVMSVDDIFLELNPQLEPALPELPDRKAFKKGRGKAEGKAGGKKERTQKKEEGAGRKTPGQLFASLLLPPEELKDDEEPQIATNRVAIANPPPLSREPNPKLTEEQARILSLLDAEWRNADDLTAASGLPAGRVVAALAMLKIMRLADQMPGQLYRRK